MTRQTTEGKTIDVSFDGKRCIHARNCVMGLPGVFEANAKGPWIHPDAEDAEQIAALVHICPSGALDYHRKDGGANEAAAEVNTIRIRENGPLVVRAEIELAGDTMLRATLCRCGQSQNKPFCDGSHNGAEFAATGEPASKEPTQLETRDGVLKITPQPNGSLRVEGNVEIVCGSGRVIERTTRAFLCRCGHSKNKPYCDGSHKTIGFTA